MSNTPVTTALKKLLADSYTLLIKTHNYHWNVEGENFASLHLLFEGQYNELFAAVDVVAERIRALDDKAPGGLKAFAALTSITEGDAARDATAMLKDLYGSQQQLIKTIDECRKKAEKAGDDVTVDLCNLRAEAHGKAAWMLKSSLPPAQRSKLQAA